MALPAPEAVLVSATLLLPALVLAVVRWRGAIRRWKLPLVAGVWLAVVANLANTVIDSGSLPSGLDRTLVGVLVVVASLLGIALSVYGWRRYRTDPDATVDLSPPR
ncbi:hypothetical protein GOC74_11170 [Halomicrobium mukohataei]|uniref:Uncharacterized protein n=1 Tax=Halomicrobium mukohataei TaxID=57705 RepID=A0A847UBN9_9EURY|nr:hypothetical protein [Halomicrobium mukohataei]NLV10489.1 hypothetical protein [Halomicrobium mukohataei]